MNAPDMSDKGYSEIFERKKFVLNFCKAVERRWYTENLSELCKFIGFKDLQIPGFHSEMCEFLDSDAQFKLMLVPRAHLKCIPKTERILVESGEYKTVNNINIGDKVLSFNTNLKTEWSNVVKKGSNGIREIYKIILRSGKSLRATGNHPVYTLFGYENIDTLKVGDKIATVRNIVTKSTDSKNALAIFLGSMIGDGCMSRMMFTNKDKEFRQIFMNSIKELGGESYERTPSNKSPYVGIRKMRPIVEKYEMKNKLSADKFIPMEIFKSNNETVSLFLKSLFTCDGTHRTGRGNVVSYCSISKRLCLDVQSLLLRFDIRSILNELTIKVNNEPYLVYHLDINGYSNYLNYMAKIGFWGEKGRNYILPKNDSIFEHTNVDLIPREWKKLMPRGHGLKLRNLGIRIDNNYSTTIRKVLEVAKYFDSDILSNIAKSDIYWDEIVSIEKDGAEETWDIEIEKNHNFCVNDILTHNSSVGTVAYSIQCLLKNRNERILIVNYTWNNSRTFLRSIKESFEKPEFIKLFGDMRSKKWTEEEIIVKGRTKLYKEPSIATTGMEKMVTSQHYDLIIFDDLVCRENVSTQEMRNKVKQFFTDCLPLLEPDGQILVMGTKWNYGDLYSWMLKTMQDRYKVFFRRCTTDGTLNDKSTIIYPKKFNLAKLLDTKRQMGSYDFAMQYMNEEVDDENAAFKNSWMQYYKDRDLYELIEGRLVAKPLRVSMTVDPALSEDKFSDCTGITICGMDSNNKIYVLYAKKHRVNPTELISLIMNLHKKWLPIKTGIEVTGYQKSICFALKAEMQKTGYYFSVTEIKTYTRDTKQNKIRGLIPYFENKDIFIGENMGDLEDQLLHFPKGSDDILDSLAMHLELFNTKPLEVNDDEELGDKLHPTKAFVFDEPMEFAVTGYNSFVRAEEESWKN